MPLGSLMMTFKQFTKENTRQDEEYTFSFFWMLITINNNNNNNNNNNKRQKYNNNNNDSNKMALDFYVSTCN